MFDPKTTYEVKGADTVTIHANSDSDKHRFCTLQVFARNRIVPTLPRYGQPKLTICFRGTGTRIKAVELQAYHTDVNVQWQKKAWYDSLTTNKWVVECAMEEMDPDDLPLGSRYLVVCDNLGGQTKKINPKFSELLLHKCSADVWNLLEGCTDMLQVVDKGLGAAIKKEAFEVQAEWLRVDKNYTEWRAATLPASRRRVLTTWWYGEAYDRVCKRYDYISAFNKTGTNLTADGSGDDLLSLEKLPDFTFENADADRDPYSGEFPVEDADSALDSDAEQPVESDNEMEEFSADDNSDVDNPEDAETTDDDEEGPAFEQPYGEKYNEECPVDIAVSVVKHRIAHRFDDRLWYIGFVRRQVMSSEREEENGQFAVKYDDSRSEFMHDLFSDDYGKNKMWVLMEDITHDE